MKEQKSTMKQYCITELYSHASNSKTPPPWDTRNSWNYQETSWHVGIQRK